MNDKLRALHLKIAEFESTGFTKEANTLHELFVKLANEDFEDDDDIERSDPDNPPPELIRNVPVLFNSETNQPIIHGGKYLAALPNDQDLPEIRGKVKEMTGIENMTIVHIPVNILKVEYVHSDSDIKETDAMMAAFEAGIEDVPDFVHVLMIDDHIFDFDGKDLIFASVTDAMSFGRVIEEYQARKGQPVSISTAPIAVSIADTRENGMSLPEMYDDDEFIWMSDSSFRVTKIPETIQDLIRELNIANMSSPYTVDRLQKEKMGDYDFDTHWSDDMNDDNDGNDRFSEVLKKLHKIASILENNHLLDEANLVSDVFIRVAKKKAKKKKNTPNNPSLWAECQAWAKRTYEIHPSAYSNSAAAKRYKSKGGTWSKK